jgi:hypothetical protein
MKKWKLIGVVILALLIVIQLVPSGRPGTSSDNKNDLIINNQLPDSVSYLLKNACYDCHSNESRYPWYSYVAPVSWLVSSDVKKGRKHLNFSEWELNKKLDKAELLGDISDEINGDDMPLQIYLLMHPKARLTKQERNLLAKWTDDFGNKLFE